eukprot:Hpha_TRINITY_DN16728_c1_g2::TRINITY_DN16728_c1_g2_i3::g.78354::m.78354
MNAMVFVCLVLGAINGVTAVCTTEAIQAQDTTMMKLATGITPTPIGWGGGGICNGTWEGVTCIKGCVDKIDISDKGFKGTIDFTGLPPSLTGLHLNNNAFSGAADMSKLPPGLLLLDISYNQFSGAVDVTRLPPGLKYFILSNNKFSGNVDLGSLPESLITLYLSYNQFSGNVEFGKLPKGLLYMWLYSNKFSGTPDLSVLPPGLTTLGLGVNNFSNSTKAFKPNTQWCVMCQSRMCGNAAGAFDCQTGTWFCKDGDSC